MTKKERLNLLVMRAWIARQANNDPGHRHALHVLNTALICWARDND